MKVTCDYGQGIVCHLAGNLEATSAVEFYAATATVIGEERVVFEMSQVPFIDSAGLVALLSTVRQVREWGGEAVVCSPTPSVKRVLSTVLVPRSVLVVEGLEAAERHFALLTAA